MSGSVLVGVVLFFLLSLWIGPGIFLVGIPFVLSRPITRVRTDKPLVALTFDDGPHPVYTEQILGILAAHGARATFFVTASNAERHPDIVRAIVAGGHDVQNHSTSHRHLLSLFSCRSQYEDIRTAQEIIERISGCSPRLYRPPMGYKTPETFRAAARAGLVVCGWHLKGLDTVITDPDRITALVVSRARRGSVILLHDSGSLDGTSADRSATVRALPRIIAGLAEKGLRSVTVSNLIEKER
ncbi:MAG: polysaccharide deacetylase family protein [Deltaproteobacteria bacterium]|nr:polysaccharide deacetylase family protein [Candidatus Zymogenaceae bacterium]